MTVYLKCLKISGRLRVQIISPGYNNQAFCQFPSDIRKENASYKVPAEAISVGQGRGEGKYFYRVNKKLITIVPENENQTTDQSGIKPECVLPTKVFLSTECCVCISDTPNIVLVPCGHLCLCSECSDQITGNCPMCRTKIACKINKNQLT